MGSGKTAGKIISVAFFRIDHTALWLFRPLVYLKSLASPLAWLSIGVTLGSVSVKKAASEATAWLYSFNKVVLVPLINLVILLLLTITHLMPIDFVALATIIIMMATPTAAVVAAYAIGFDKEAMLTSNCSLLSTFAAVVAIPIWIVILQLIQAMGIFK